MPHARRSRPSALAVFALAVALLGAPGCFRSQDLPSAPDGPPPPDATRPESSDSILRIPKEPLTTHAHQVQRGTGIRFDVGETPLMDATHGVTLALGDGYPLALEIELTGVSAGRCDGPEGRVEITSVSGGDDALSIRRSSAGSYELRSNGEESRATMRVRGTFVADTPFVRDACWNEMEGRTQLDFDLEVTAVSREVHGVELQLGSVFFSETTIGSVRYNPLDRAGFLLYPANASSARPVDLELWARDGSELRVGADGDLSSVRLPASETVVEVAAPAGPSVELHVVDPTRVTELEYHVTLLGGGWERIESGDTFDASEHPWLLNHLVVEMQGPPTVDGEPISSDVPSSLFELTSATPAICRVRELSADGSARDGVIGTAELLADGECRLRWRAPTLDQGRGLSGELDATFLNVDTLMPID